MAKSVRWDLIADPRGFQRGFREANRSADTFSRGIKRTVGLIGGAFAGIQVAGFLKDAIAEAREAAKVTRQTNAVIKATGGVANVSAKDVDRLASSLMRKVGVDDDVIAAGQNMLLTFKGVRNEVGKGNDIFNQTTKVALDMTAALNQGEISQSGLEQTTMRLGKALNDPIKGISALTRVGVTFTDSQKEQIKTLVESGDVMGAQKIILKELGSEFGGAAEAAADPWARLTVVFGEVKEEIGTALLPAFEAVADWLSVALPKAIDTTKEALRTVKKWWDDNKTSVEDLTAILVDTFVPGVGESDEAVKDFTTSLGTLANFLTDVAVFTLELIKVWLTLEHVTIGMISWWASGVVAAGHLVNAIDKLSGGTGHAGDEMVAFGQDLKTQATKELKEVRQSAKDAQVAIDKLHGKDVHITAKGVWVPPKGLGSMHDVVGSLAHAAGGPIFGPGTSTSDSVPALLSTGEHVLSAREVRGLGGHGAVERMRQSARGFAEGGAVGVSGPGGIAAKAQTSIDRLAAALDRLTLKIPLKGDGDILSFIRSVDPLPYIWGAAGPHGYDCSGLVSAVLGKHTGRGGGHGQRYFTTSSIGVGQYGLKPGLGGVLNIGVTPGRGHMAGSYMGMGFEAESTRTGIKVGGAASPPSSFARHYHLARGGAIDPRALRDLDIGGDPGRLRVNGKVLDKGGFLAPGATLAINNTGRPEPVGIDYDKMADAFVRALERNPPVVAVDDVHQGLLAKKRRSGRIQLGLT